MVQILPFSDRLKRVVRRRPVLMLLGFSLLACAFPFPEKVRAAQHLLGQSDPKLLSTQQGTLLERGKPVTRELSAGQKHEYQITLAAGQYASVTVKQQGIDVLVRVLPPEGQEVVFDVERSNHGVNPWNWRPNPAVHTV